jgi:hypothetical protein
MSEKHESQSEDDLWFCFVNFEPESPTVHVIPALVVSAALRIDHQTWLDTPGRNGQAHNPSNMRRLKPKMSGQSDGWINQYLENWDQITASTY